MTSNLNMFPGSANEKQLSQPLTPSHCRVAHLCFGTLSFCRGVAWAASSYITPERNQWIHILRCNENFKLRCLAVTKRSSGNSRELCRQIQCNLFSHLLTPNEEFLLWHGPDNRYVISNGDWKEAKVHEHRLTRQTVAHQQHRFVPSHCGMVSS